MLRIVMAMAVLGATALAGCDLDSGESRTQERDTDAISHVVARVGGRSIGAAEVEARMTGQGLSAEAALQQLIDEELLVQEAKRLGFAEDRASERTIERLMVRSMLHDFEQENTPESITDKEVREDYALYADEFQGRPVADVEDEIRERLSQAKRFVRLVETVQSLEAQGLVEYDEQGVERLLSMAGLPERAE